MTPRRKQLPIQWVEQTEGGCGIGALAMLLDTSYARICALAPAFCLKCGVEEEDFDQFLAEHGYAVERRWFHKWYDSTRKDEWPPRPWAQRHVALVWETEEDEDAHYVVMDHKGIVYDPADEEFVPSRLSRYYKVEWVAAVYNVNRRTRAK